MLLSIQPEGCRRFYTIRHVIIIKYVYVPQILNVHLERSSEKKLHKVVFRNARLQLHLRTFYKHISRLYADHDQFTHEFSLNHAIISTGITKQIKYFFVLFFFSRWKKFFNKKKIYEYFNNKRFICALEMQTR